MMVASGFAGIQVHNIGTGHAFAPESLHVLGLLHFEHRPPDIGGVLPEKSLNVIAVDRLTALVAPVAGDGRGSPEVAEIHHIAHRLRQRATQLGRSRSEPFEIAHRGVATSEPLTIDTAKLLQRQFAAVKSRSNVAQKRIPVALQDALHVTGTRFLAQDTPVQAVFTHRPAQQRFLHQCTLRARLEHPQPEVVHGQAGQVFIEATERRPHASAKHGTVVDGLRIPNDGLEIDAEGETTWRNDPGPGMSTQEVTTSMTAS